MGAPNIMTARAKGLGIRNRSQEFSFQFRERAMPTGARGMPVREAIQALPPASWYLGPRGPSGVTAKMDPGPASLMSF